MSLFRRRSTLVSCYYCLSLIDPSASSSSHTNFNPSSFRCPHCACWNRYDAHGQIVGDEPAMRDEQLNHESFSKRGFPDRNQLPSLTGQRSSSIFCRTCLTNQTLLINLRAAYLPARSDPTYATRIAQLPAYVAALQTRYPPVCADCQPGVDAEIAKKDEYARTRALGGALRSSARPPSRAGSMRDAEKSRRKRMRTWRVRGVLWTASFFGAILANVAGFYDLDIPPRLQTLTPLLPLLVLGSVVWTFWDPTYSLQQKSQIQGRQVRVGGRQKYIFLQGLAWVSRLSTSVLLCASWLRVDWDILHLRNTTTRPNEIQRKQLYFGATLALELSVLILSYFSITIRKPSPVRLIDTSAHRGLSDLNANGTPSTSPPTSSNSYIATPTPLQPEPDHFATLSLSGNPVITPTAVNPMFGRPSLGSTENQGNAHSNGSAFDAFSLGDDEYDDADADTARLPRRRNGARDPDAMDWEPASTSTSPFKQSQAQTHTRTASTDDGSWLRRQRFFPPEEPTGLEGLLMRTRLLDEDEAARSALAARGRGGPGAGAGMGVGTGGGGAVRWHWGWVYSASLVPVAALLVGIWLRS